MATKSILKTIHIKSRDSARALANALEYAKNKTEKTVIFSKSYSEASRDEIKAMFGAENDRI